MRRAKRSRLRERIHNERAVAVPMALICLLVLTGMVLAFLTVSAFEPQISANHEAGTQARYVAEAGLEWAFDHLVDHAAAWNTLLTTNGGVMASARALPGLGTTSGTFSVSARNDTFPADATLTGVTGDSTGTNDTNGRIIVTAIGTVGKTRRTMTAVMQKTALPPFNAALSLPGVQANTNIGSGAVTIDGTDWNTDGTPGSSTPVYSIAVAPGDIASEATVADAVAGNDGIRGLSATAPPSTATGNGSVAAPAVDSRLALTSRQVNDFVAAMKTQADITVDVGNATAARQDDVGSTCGRGPESGMCWGTPSHPKIVYVKGDTDPATQLLGLEIAGTSEGTGILIIEGASARVTGRFTWNGPIIVTGPNARLQFGDTADAVVYGTVIVNELSSEPGVQFAGGGTARLRYSAQALALMQERLGRRLGSSRCTAGRSTRLSALAPGLLVLIRASTAAEPTPSSRLSGAAGSRRGALPPPSPRAAAEKRRSSRDAHLYYGPRVKTHA
jgi:hypothetical protein